ncbi:MAG: alpha amylase C-terminal domain-containing protein [Bacteroidales bacterium]
MIELKLWQDDPYLEPYKKEIWSRHERTELKRLEISGYNKSFSSAVNAHLYYGVRKTGNCTTFREWAPNATALYLLCDLNSWKKDEKFSFEKKENGNWELNLQNDILKHGDLFKWLVVWNGGEGERIPAYATRVVQDNETKLFSAQIWDPVPYEWKHNSPKKIENPLIYEAHIGMSTEEYGIATYNSFRRDVLPEISKLGYNTIQMMAIQEHPYYGSFGYQVSSFFAASSRFGTPEELKQLIDEAHSLGIAVVIDIVHSHSVSNSAEGLSEFDGTKYLYFHEGARGDHPAWGSRCFNYGRDEVLMFLLSNCKYWLEEYKFDGFRFDGITSMIYLDHGLGKDFTDYSSYFNGNQDIDAIVYLALANKMIKEINPSAVTIAEDVSGMPGLAAPFESGGIGFDFRMSMGVADHWIKWIKELKDEQWNVGDIFWELTNKRADEKTVSYAECHDQAMVGDKTIIFRLLDAEMYTSMSRSTQSLVVDRGIALHKMIRLITVATAGDGYLNFMGNEFGHPEWIDFPRTGNDWSFHYARRQWSLAGDKKLRYKYLLDFDTAMIHLIKKSKIYKYRPQSLYQHVKQQVLIFGRGEYIFAFNFSPSGSYPDFKFNAPPGRYNIVLDTDWLKFGGFARNSEETDHFTIPEKEQNLLSVYLPSRSAIVFKKGK